MISANYVDGLELRIKELTAEADRYRELARQYTELASKGIYYTVDELVARDAVIRAEAGRAGYMECVKDFNLSNAYCNGWASWQMADQYGHRIIGGNV